MTLLDELEAISQRREDGGMIHGGHIHYIQGHASGDDLPILKHGIYGVLERIPDKIPRDLPALVDGNPNFEPDSVLIAAINEINSDLMIPLCGFDVVAIIRAADEYIALAKADAETSN